MTRIHCFRVSCFKSVDSVITSGARERYVADNPVRMGWITARDEGGLPAPQNDRLFKPWPRVKARIADFIPYAKSGQRNQTGFILKSGIDGGHWFSFSAQPGAESRVAVFRIHNIMPCLQPLPQPGHTRGLEGLLCRALCARVRPGHRGPGT